ncbi:MAG: ABC transporter permease subunit [Akkermansiaceae bacterium]|nr:ABC transporter permease subunit [Akkermansiaceae bacterium]
MMTPEPSRWMNWMGSRRWTLLAAVGLFAVGLVVLRADPRDLQPSEGGLKLAGDFLKAAVQPALDYEAGDLPVAAPPFWEKVGAALWLTVRYAVVAMSLAVAGGIVFGILGSRAWWPVLAPNGKAGPEAGGTNGNGDGGLLWALKSLRLLVRGAATLARSVHELLWALLFLTAIGTSPLAAVLAIALPYGGTLAKVFSELLDEQDRSAAGVMRSGGSGSFTAFVVGIVARAFPDLVTYAMYRLECAVRSSAVLGFLGIPTIGYHISTAYEDGHLHEIWTYLYALMLAVIVIDQWGALVRKRLSRPKAARKAGQPGDAVEALRRKRPRSGFLRASLVVMVIAVAAAWWTEGQWRSDLPPEQRARNLERFLKEIVPHPVAETGDWSKAWPWMAERLWPKGTAGLHQTFHIGTAAILLAGLAALLAAPIAARSLARRDPLGIPGGGEAVHGWRAGAGSLLRIGALAARSIPEYILAFLLLQVFGPTVWPLVLALAIHNSGILVRLGSEVIDNQRNGAAESMICGGAGRQAAYLGALLPECFNRFLLLLFYRWETCIREATVLGMLGVLSLGSLIDEANTRLFYDDMVFYVLLGAALVFAGDVTSDLVRRRLRGSAEWT